MHKSLENFGAVMIKSTTFAIITDNYFGFVKVVIGI